MNSLILVTAAGLLWAGVGASQEQLYGIGIRQLPRAGSDRPEIKTASNFIPLGPFSHNATAEIFSCKPSKLQACRSGPVFSSCKASFARVATPCKASSNSSSSSKACRAAIKACHDANAKALATLKATKAKEAAKEAATKAVEAAKARAAAAVCRKTSICCRARARIAAKAACTTTCEAAREACKAATQAIVVPKCNPSHAAKTAKTAKNATAALQKITALDYADSYPDNLAAAKEYVSNEGGIPFYDPVYGEEREAFITLNGCKYENVLYDGEIISIKPSTSFDYCKETCINDCTHFTFYHAEQCALFTSINYGRHSAFTADSGKINCIQNN